MYIWLSDNESDFFFHFFVFNDFNLNACRELFPITKVHKLFPNLLSVHNFLSAMIMKNMVTCFCS